MKRNAAFGAVLAAGVLVIVLVSTASPASRSGPTVVPPQSVQSMAPVPPSSPVDATGQPAVATAAPTVAATPRPGSSPIGHVVPPAVGARGWATWQPGAGDWGSAGPILQALGIRVGQLVRVQSASGHFEVRVAPGGCACGDRRGIPTLIDLSRAAWIDLCGNPSAGICRVVVTW